MSEYIFVWKNGGWWLKITEPEQLFDYHEKTDAKWGKEFQSLIKSKEFGTGETHASTLAYTIGNYGAKRRLNPIQATLGFRGEIIKAQLEFLAKYGELYINKNGGYHYKTKNNTYEQFLRRKDFILPDFEKKDIRIKSFPGGQHFYAYIGEMEVRDGDIRKWDTYEEAYKKAVALVTSCER